MSEPIVEPPPGDTGTVAPPAPQADPPAPKPVVGAPQENPLAAVELGGTGNPDYADPDV